MRETLLDFRNEAYGETAALRYNIIESRPSGFAMRIAPKVRAFYQKTSTGRANQRLLDVACGTGQLAAYFLDYGFEVVGIDQSSHMLKYARVNNAKHVTSGQSQFNERDTSNFHFDPQFGLSVCTFNSLNHLASFGQVEGCLASVLRALVPGGYFIFDINTRRGLKNIIETVDLYDTDEEIILRKRIFDGERVILYASGCFLHEGIWIRYRETIFKIIIDTKELRQSMLDNGWSSVTYTTDDLMSPVKDPEMEHVAYVVARKGE